MRKFIVVLLVILISLVLFLAGAWLLVKNEVIHFSFTEKWLRQQNFQEAMEKDIKVLVLGDSQLEKWPFEQCLYREMAEYFDEKRMGYLNAAHYGFGPIEYLDQLIQTIPIYKPDYLLIFYYAGNDLSDVSYRSDNKAHPRDYPVIFREAVENNSEEDSYTSEPKSKVFDWESFEKGGIDPTLIAYARNRMEHPTAIGREYVNPHILNLGIWKPDFHYDNCTLITTESEYGWYRSLQQFERIAELSDSLNIKTMVVAIPCNVQVDSSHFEFYRKAKFHVDYDLLYANAPQQILFEFCLNNQMTYLDLLPFFKTAEHTESLFFENDDHLTEAGHELAFSQVKTVIDNLVSDTNKKAKNRKLNYFRRFEQSVILQKIENIRADKAWYDEVERKAIENGFTLDSQLYLDARYVLENFGK
jgi:hypothetical protein